jgi:hypothetical protein
MSVFQAAKTHIHGATPGQRRQLPGQILRVVTPFFNVQTQVFARYAGWQGQDLVDPEILRLGFKICPPCSLTTPDGPVQRPD